DPVDRPHEVGGGELEAELLGTLRWPDVDGRNTGDLEELSLVFRGRCCDRDPGGMENADDARVDLVVLALLFAFGDLGLDREERTQVDFDDRGCKLWRGVVHGRKDAE